LAQDDPNQSLLGRFFRESFISNINLYSNYLAEKIVPAFSNINGEADKIEEEEYKRLLRQISHDYIDKDSPAEQAREFLVEVQTCQPDYRLHTLIHTRLKFDLAQYLEAYAISFSVSGIAQPCSSDSTFAN
jgi:hypothetical protein